jgi:hypothetical protein
VQGIEVGHTIDAEDDGLTIKHELLHAVSKCSIEDQSPKGALQC